MVGRFGQPQAAAMFFCHELAGRACGQLSRLEKRRMVAAPTAMKLLLRLAVLLPVLLASCARPAYQQRGYASYIADHYAGHRTSSGDMYHPQGWTAAHNTLPFGTQVKVKNNHNGRSVNLTVNDRFPNYPGRVINVSRAAAEYLQLPPYQLADVTVTAKTIPGYSGSQPVAQPPPQPPPQPAYGAPPPAGYPAATTYPSGPPPATYSQPPPVYPNTPPPPVSPPPPGY
jgi:rare lipoprotein A